MKYVYVCRKAWIRLGDMSKEDAQKELVHLLYKAAPQLEEYVTQQWKSLKLGITANRKMYEESIYLPLHLCVIVITQGKG